MIPIIYDKSDKKIAIKIYNKLKSKGIQTSTDNLETILNSEEEAQKITTAILILSTKANNSEQIIKKYDQLYENGINIIPFIINDVDLNLTTKHFLNTHDWIDAYNINTDEAIDDLIILINETSDTQKQIQNKPQKQTNETKHSIQKNQKILIISISIIFIAILAFLIFGNKDNNPISQSSNPNELITGKWKLANYQDNMQRTRQEYIDFIKSVSALKNNFLLIFKKDGTFDKYGFARPEHGNWKLDPQNMELHMWPPNSTIQKSDVLKIQKLTKDTLIMTIATKTDSLTLINTKFTLYKE
jgi:uncharacterized membrane protein YvbJ